MKRYLIPASLLAILFGCQPDAPTASIQPSDTPVEVEVVASGPESATQPRWQLQQGELSLAGKTVDWRSESLDGCSACRIKGDQRMHPGGSLFSAQLYENDQWRAAYREETVPWVELQHQGKQVRLPILVSDKQQLSLQIDQQMLAIEANQLIEFSYHRTSYQLWIDSVQIAKSHASHVQETADFKLTYRLLKTN